MFRRYLRAIRRRLRRVPRSTIRQQPQQPQEVVPPPITITPEHQNIQSTPVGDQGQFETSPSKFNDPTGVEYINRRSRSVGPTSATLPPIDTPRSAPPQIHSFEQAEAYSSNRGPWNDSASDSRWLRNPEEMQRQGSSNVTSAYPAFHLEVRDFTKNSALTYSSSWARHHARIQNLQPIGLDGLVRSDPIKEKFCCSIRLVQMPS
ncbi:MAG: hypothetical protein LQ345_004111 [Seirophora villosa]|nr:MAG: hypothetical protein LQ345_004111 [Seirophora villosa]